MKIRVMSKKIRRTEFEWSVRQSLDEEETGEQQQHKIPSLTGGNKQKGRGKVDKSSGSHKGSGRGQPGVKKVPLQEKEAKAAERRRRGIGRWEIPPLNPREREKRRGWSESPRIERDQATRKREQ